MNKIGAWLKRKKTFLFAAAALAVLTAGMSLAFFTDGETAANTVKTGEVQIDIEENIDGLKKTDISVTSTGKSPCYVRMRVDVPVLKYEEGGEEKILSPDVNFNDRDDTPVETDGSEWNGYTEGKEISTGKDSSDTVKTALWVKKNDGYWYLSVPLKAGEKAALCNQAEYKELMLNGTLNLPAGISKDQLSILVYAEAVQSGHIDVGDAKGAEAAYKAFQQLKNDEN